MIIHFIDKESDELVYRDNNESFIEDAVYIYKNLLYSDGTYAYNLIKSTFNSVDSERIWVLKINKKSLNFSNNTFFGYFGYQYLYGREILLITISILR